MTTRLIERWLPIAKLGEESVRERTPMTPYPAPNRLHVWWARRPLVAARAAVLASLLPEDAGRDKFMHILGIHGDPIAARRKIDQAKRTGERFEGQAFSYRRAFLYSPNEDELEWIKKEMDRGDIETGLVLDPTAGGGSISFESSRLGFQSHANDLNPVSALILHATLTWPRVHGTRLLEKFDDLTQKFVQIKEEKLAPMFPREPTPGCITTNYLWARTITCVYCDGVIPLSPNWRLAPDGTGVRVHPDLNTRKCSFEIVETVRNQSEGTISGGNAKCPYPDCGRVVDGAQIKSQAQSGELGQQLCAVIYKEKIESRTKTGKLREKWARRFREPSVNDDNAEEIKRRLSQKRDDWDVLDILPSEVIPEGLKTNEPINFGMGLWQEMFSPRQLLCHGTNVEVFRDMLLEEDSDGRLDDLAKAAFVYLSFVIDKMLNWNSYLSSWNVNALSTRSTFDQHNFSMKLAYAEMNPLTLGVGYDWVVNQTRKCIEELVDLSGANSLSDTVTHRTGQGTMEFEPKTPAPPVTVTCGSADNMAHLSDGSVSLVVIDPPYYANVMYAELSDFFYVWLKRTAGYVYPEWFMRQLADKDNEAVANPVRFKGQKGASVLANRYYQQRMASIFAECRRVLKPDGIMTLMFTHKATGAWDALTTGLVEGGFTITASWPINTEASGSLHIRDKSAANSTIFLVCRPRAAKASDQVEYWEDVAPLVAKVVREKVEEYQASGITGVDLYLACFGPALQVFAEHWPLKRGQPRPQSPKPRRRATLSDEEEDPYAVTPEDALEAARSAVKEWRLQQILHTTRRADLELLTEWFVLAWDTFRAPEFPYDEALRLARVVGLDLDSDVIGRLAEKKASNVVLWDSAKRAAKGALGPPDGSRGMIDALHHAAHMVRTQGLNAGRDLLERSGAENQSGFAIALTALLEVLPVSSTYTHVTGETGAVADAASDFDALENLRRLAFTDRVPEPQQLRLWMEPVA